MKKTLFVVGIIILVLFLLIGTVNYLNRREVYLMDKAQQSGDVSLCDKTFDEVNRRSCIVGVALERKDLTICDKYLPEVREGCYVNVAVNLEDSSICEKVGDRFESFQCKRAIAVRTSDLSICEAMLDEGYKNSCTESVNLAFK